MKFHWLRDSGRMSFHIVEIILSVEQKFEVDIRIWILCRIALHQTKTKNAIRKE